MANLNGTNENIGSWERATAKQHNLHSSWLAPSCYGETCPCCKKLRTYDHYITDAGVCVFCSVACKGKQGCQSKIFTRGLVQPTNPNQRPN